MKYRVILAALVVCFAISGAMADAPGLISYQTRLEDGGGAPVTVPTQLRIRFYQGGDGTTFPSAGTLVYHELVTVTPSADGIVSHLVGSGTAQTGCIEGTCQLTASDFPDGATTTWLEVMVDPDGSLGNGDDDVLLPRTRFGAVGYAMHADQLDGRDASAFLDTSATSQSKSGTLAVGNLECNDCIDAGDIGSGAVGSSEVAPNSLQQGDLAAGSVGSSEVIDNSLTTADLATGSVASAEIVDNSITWQDLAPYSCGASEIGTGAVSSLKIADGSIQAIDMQVNSVGSEELQMSAVTNIKLNLSTYFSPSYSTSSVTEAVHNIGVHEYCSLAKVQLNTMISSGTNSWCSVSNTGSTWYLRLRSNGTTQVQCQAVCF